MMKNLFSALTGHITAPAQPFLEQPEGRRLSYGDLFKLSAQYANALLTLGLQPGDRVAAQVDKSPEAIVLYLATLRAGGVYLPLNNAYREKEIAYFLKDAEPRVFVCRPEDAKDLQTLAKECAVPHLEILGATGDGSLAERAAQESDLFDDVLRDKGDLAAILYTSGTTGRSKGAMLTCENLYSNARVLADYWHFTSEDVLLHALPIFHTHGLFVAVNTLLLAGASMIFLPAFDSKEILRCLPRASCMMGVPTFYSRLLKEDRLTRELVSHIRLFISGSAPLSPEVHREFEKRTGQVILERYGMTETGMNSSNPYDAPRRPGTVGLPLPGIEIRIVDRDSGAALPPGEVGIIEIRGPNVFKGYWRNPEKTAAEFRDDGFFISGDLGAIDDDGYIAIAGRDKDLIITGGFNVYPAEVEAALDALPEVAESAVIGLPHDDFGEAVTAVVVGHSTKNVPEDQVRKALSADLAKYKVPKRVLSLDALPRNAMGKVQKNVLKETFKDTYAS